MIGMVIGIVIAAWFLTELSNMLWPAPVFFR
jgi:hypothetical protein